MSGNTVLQDYKAELAYAIKMKADGITIVPAAIAGAVGSVTIDEYIARWQKGIDAMEEGADQSQFNY